MEDKENQLRSYIQKNKIQAEHIHLDAICHSVQDAAQAVEESEDHIIKNVCMLGDNQELIVAIVMGADRASTSRVSKALQIPRPRIADEEEVLAHSGYPAGGVPSFGFDATFIVDPKVMEHDYVYTGGGSPYSLVKIETNELVQANKGYVVRARK